MEAKKKKYVGGGKRIVFDNGGEVINIYLFADKLQADEKGYVRLTIGERREVSDKGDTHSVWVNEYKPKEKSSVGTDLPF